MKRILRQSIEFRAFAVAGCLLVAVLAAAADPIYEQARDALDDRQWQRAVELFDQVIAAGGERSDAALYWKADAQRNAGHVDRALATLGRLRREWTELGAKNALGGIALDPFGRGRHQATVIHPDLGFT